MSTQHLLLYGPLRFLLLYLNYIMQYEKHYHVISKLNVFFLLHW